MPLVSDLQYRWTTETKTLLHPRRTIDADYVFVSLLESTLVYCSLLMHSLEAKSHCDLNPLSSYDESLQHNVSSGPRSFPS